MFWDQPSREMPLSPPPPGLEEIQRQGLSRLFGRIVGARLIFFPILVALAVWLGMQEPTTWRKVLLGATAILAGAFFALEAVRYRRRGLRPASIPVNLGVVLVGQILLATATGGLESPFVFTFIPVAVFVGMGVPDPWRLILIGVQIASVWTFAALSASRGAATLRLDLVGRVPAGESPIWLAVAGAVLTFVLVLGSSVGRGVRSAFDAMVRHALTAQQESLHAHAERAEELSALSAEIAHELKNPLASVKGLAGLLAPGIPEGKAAERLAILRHEVDRMHGILDEFLNFSRPLVPLALGRIDLGALCREVATLHEGMAQERGVALVVRGDARARCDARKVKQVLINLVQNAIEASAAGGRIDVEIEERGEGEARVAVLDRGRGLDLALGDRIFEPGVTTKDRGSGIGLTVARALARQHGGDLTLATRPGGGCAAELRLPSAAATIPPGEAA